MLEVQDIVKQYAKHLALDHVSFSIKKGSIFGLLGPNGAGKTSLIRIINQITAPDNGEILFNGEPLSEKHISQIGYLPEERGLYKKMLIGEQMLYLAQLKGLSRADAVERIKHWFEKMDMETWWNKRVEDLSKGMQQKVQFVATVIHQPELIILDEPFTGFDPVNVDVIKNEIIDLNKKGATIIFSTHRMESVEELCDSIVLINKSKKVLDGKVSEIKNTYRKHQYLIKYSDRLPLLNPEENELFKVLNIQELEDGNKATIELVNNYNINDVLGHLINQVQLQEFTEIIPSIHDIFVKQVKEN
ncbi:ABC transporter ATP-binding protein [Albibacterium sp.]|uniref:ABC transporter ATP-binding protein n=1 Tax=Albibacterium sp. TaxID=2952885 RepID=UPI002BD6FD31|nr:ABC transporter ATP-binding protein [Albibacterium sp.]HUH18862.1 ABC transporter ATP-binding protein [Albibacterium sp.]